MMTPETSSHDQVASFLRPVLSLKAIISFFSVDLVTLWKPVSTEKRNKKEEDSDILFKGAHSSNLAPPSSCLLHSMGLVLQLSMDLCILKSPHKYTQRCLSLTFQAMQYNQVDKINHQRCHARNLKQFTFQIIPGEPIMMNSTDAHTFMLEIGISKT